MEAPDVITRLQWGARPFKGLPRPLGAVQQIVVHHAGGYGAATRHEGARQVAALQKLHQGPQCNCPDIAYHFLVDAGGHIYQGRPYLAGSRLDERPEFVLGGHILNVDSHKLGICLLGCFHDEGGECCDTPTAEALDGLERLLSFMCRHYGVHPADILTHRDFVDTTCPGEKLYRAVGQLRGRMADYALA
jgi:hypothetical protein